MKKWKRGDLAIYQGGIDSVDLTPGCDYVVNNVGEARGNVYLQVVTDDREVVDLRSTHFVRWERRK